MKTGGLVSTESKVGDKAAKKAQKGGKGTEPKAGQVTGQTQVSLQSQKAVIQGEPKSLFFNLPNMLFWAAAIRFGFMFLNETFDITTDVDYHVYTEGARELAKGGNPYDRFTYRYTPLIAYMMLPNLTVPYFGKLLFNAMDLWAILYMDLFLRRVQGLDSVRRYKALAFWALNPFMAYINGRGSCESVSLLLLTAMLYHLRLAQENKAETLNMMLSGLFYGLLIHFRIYPVIFGLTLYILINKHRVFPRLNATVFGVCAVGINVLLVGFFYRLYGDLFLQECYLYHLKRKDPRHNYSIFWIQTVFEYFADTSQLPVQNLGQILLGLRLGLIVLVSVAWRKHHLYAMLIQTFVFTTLNTVYTAQYVTWEIQLLPYLLADSDVFSRHKKIGFWTLVSVWFLNLEFWAVQSSQFENKGQNTFYMMHLANLGYFLIRILFLHYFLENRIGKLVF